MTTITKERIELFIKNPLENGLTRGEQMELARIALASLEAEPDYIRYECCRCGWETIEDWRENDVCPKCNHKPMGTTALYTATPAPAVPAVLERLRAIVADPRALPRRKEWVSGQQYSYVLLENVEAMVDEACHAAMLQGSQPVSQTYKLPPMSSNEVNDAAWKLHNMLTEHGPLNGCQFNNLKECFYEALKVAMRNYPVIPDGWISCSERMPNDKQYVWCWGKSYGWTECDTFEGYYDWSRNKWWAVTDDGEEPASKVTHWMPLPEPPEQDGE